MIYTVWITGGLIAVILFLIGLCALDNGVNAVKVLSLILIVVMVGWLGVTLGAFIMGIEVGGKVCRGAYLDD